MGTLMEDFIAQLDLNQYLPTALDWATNLLLALAILIVGVWLAGKVNKAIINIANKQTNGNISFTFMSCF